MIAFLVVTSIINLAVGYALAVYLGAGGAQSASDRDAVHVAANLTVAAKPSQPVEQSAPPWMQFAASPSAVAAGQPVEAAAPVAPLSPMPEEPERVEPQTVTSGTEQELLAGIEEFRNQLAQLKSHSFDDAMPRPFAPQAAGAR